MESKHSEHCEDLPLEFCRHYFYSIFNENTLNYLKSVRILPDFKSNCVHDLNKNHGFLESQESLRNNSFTFTSLLANLKDNIY